MGTESSKFAPSVPETSTSPASLNSGEDKPEIPISKLLQNYKEIKQYTSVLSGLSPSDYTAWKNSDAEPDANPDPGKCAAMKKTFEDSVEISKGRISFGDANPDATLPLHSASLFVADYKEARAQFDIMHKQECGAVQNTTRPAKPPAPGR